MYKTGNDKDDNRFIHRSTIFGDIIEADHMFPSQEAKGLSDEQSALVVRNKFSDIILLYPQSECNDQTNYKSFRHFAGKYLSDKKDVLFVSDNAKELTGAASRLDWIPDPSVPRYWPHNANCAREVRAIKELARPAHVAARFHRKLWPLFIDFTAKARTFFGLNPVLRHERGTETAELKIGQG